MWITTSDVFSTASEDNSYRAPSVFVLDATGGADDGDCVQKASVYKSHSSDMIY